MINVNTLRHPKEQVYLGAAAVVGVLIWLILLVATLGTIIFWAIPVAISLWITGQFFKAQLFGNSVKVSENQYPEIYNIVKECSKCLNISAIPDVFIVNSSGTTNAIAIRLLSKKYVLLYSELIDLMILKKQGIGMDELKMIIGHELAHHAAGHISPLKNILLFPAMFIPFLGNAYSRACELTADRIGAAFTQDMEASKRALVALACGSDALADQTNIESFLQQEKDVPSIAGFISELYSSHPRMTMRIKELQ
ncbi:MAG: M48 family metallopeptidase [Methanosarcinales archaeon]|nr:M48 family metallopeptidase [Methanosarcinales archaeon]